MSRTFPAGRRTRRLVILVVALAGLAGLAATAALSHSTGRVAKPDTVIRKTKVQYLFSQDAKGGTFKPVPGHAGSYVLSLTGVNPAALYFSDRPNRIVGAVSVGRMLKGLFHKKGAPAPNAAVSTVTANGSTVLMGLELRKAKYDWKKHTLVYQARKLSQGKTQDRVKGRTDTVLPATLGHTSLFVDTFYNDCDVNLSNWGDHDIPVMSQTLNNSDDSWDPAPTASTTPADQGTMSYGSESGFARGCSNTVVFGDSQGTVTISVSDPYSGANSWSCVATGAYDCEGPINVGPYDTSILGGDSLSVNFVIDGLDVYGFTCTSGNNYPNC
jgi:hypothetical protein